MLVQKGDSNKKVKCLQQGVKSAGYDIRIIDDAAGATVCVLSRGSKGEAVKNAQLRLIDLGYSCGGAGADGQYGTGTYNAVAAFQRQNGLTPDGVIGKETSNTLYSEAAIRYSEVTALKKGDTGVEIDGVAGQNTLTMPYSAAPKQYEVIQPTIPVISGTNDIVGCAINVILRGEGNYTSINDDAPISIGILQWYEERAHDLLCSINELDSQLVEDVLGKDSALVNELKQDRSVFSKRCLTTEEKAALVNLLDTPESHKVQDETARIDVAGYIEDGRGKGITDEKALIYYADLYNQSPKQAKLIVEAVEGTITLAKLHASAMANAVMNKYAARRSKAYAAANFFIGSVLLEEFVNIALAECGTAETYNNITKYGEWYGMNGEPWCAMFVSWCAKQAGLLVSSGNSNGIIPKYASVSLGMEWYKNNARFGKKGKYKPKYGDILFLKTGASHTAIVVGYDEGNDKIYTIEGNFSDKVCKVWRYASDSRITGYGTNGGTSYGYVLDDAISDAKGTIGTV